MKLVECPSCGCKFQAPNGRPATKINATKVLSQLEKSESVKSAAKELSVSTRTIQRLLKQRGVSPKDITRRKYGKKEKGE